MGNWLTQVHLEKWPLKSSVCIGDGSSIEIVDEFCYLGDMLSVDGDADATIQPGFAVVGLSSGHWSLWSLPKTLPCCCEEKFMMHVYGVVCYIEVRRRH